MINYNFKTFEYFLNFVLFFLPILPETQPIQTILEPAQSAKLNLTLTVPQTHVLLVLLALFHLEE